jgi:hypothetical protein
MKFFGIAVVVSKRRNQCNVTESELSLLLLFGLRCVPLHKETNVAIARCRVNANSHTSNYLFLPNPFFSPTHLVVIFLIANWTGA